MDEIAPRQITINSRKYDQSIRRSWKCELIEKDGPLHVFLGVFDDEINHPELGLVRCGTISYEYYWLDRWFNIFRFHEPDGTFRNYYCNVCMPATFENDVLDYVDLDIDILVWPGWKYQILDEIEYQENAAKYNYPIAVRDNVFVALTHLTDLIREKKLPVPDKMLQQNL